MDRHVQVSFMLCAMYGRVHFKIEIENDIQQGTNIPERLLNKPYVQFSKMNTDRSLNKPYANDVTL